MMVFMVLAMLGLGNAMYRSLFVDMRAIQEHAICAGDWGTPFGAIFIWHSH